MDYYLRHKKLPPNFDIVVPFLKFDQELLTELLLSNIEVLSRNQYYFIVAPLTSKPIWCQEWLPGCESYTFTSKQEALTLLKAESHRGVYLASPFQNALADSLRQKLRPLELKRIQYEVPSSFNFKYHVWTLFENNTLLICRTPASKFPLGWHEFKEDKITPPNRAYLKLWEAFCLGYVRLNKSEQVIDLGSSPGGWSWVLSELTDKVYSVDRAPLAPQISNIRNIVHTQADAFQVKPQDYKHCSWLFSDIICTPQKLLELVRKWQDESNIQNYFCTIKFKGPCDFEILNEFLKFKSSRIIHLYQNKNEVTWIKQGAS